MYFLSRLLSFVVLILVQVLILNHIHLFGVATPMLSAYFVLKFRRNYPKWGILLWSFLMGVILDSFANTPGVASASLTLIAVLQPYILSPFIPRDSVEDLKPGLESLGFSQFFYYSFVLIFIYLLTFFSLEMFSFSNILYWLECIGGSMVLTMILILVLESVRKGE